MKKIFICYRRADAAYAAGALGRDLRACFGDEQVFRDREDVGAGVSWKQQVVQEIDRESALLVLIGGGWTDAHDGAGHRRLDNADDAIRIEIEEGLREGALIVPVLLESAEMPAADKLPEPIRALADLNARPLRDGDWRYDVDRFCQALDKAGFARVATAPAAAASGARPRTSPSTTLKMAALAAAGLAALVLGARAFLAHGPAPAPAPAAIIAAPHPPAAQKAHSDDAPGPNPTPVEESPRLDIVGKWTGEAVAGHKSFTIDLWVWPTCATGKKCGTIAVSNPRCNGRTSLRAMRDGEYELSVDAFDAGSELEACRTGVSEYFRLNPDRTLSYRSDGRARGTLRRVKHTEASNTP